MNEYEKQLKDILDKLNAVIIVLNKINANMERIADTGNNVINNDRRVAQRVAM